MQDSATFPPGSMGFRLAHVSDPHLSTLAGVRPGELLNKRLLGYLSWRIRRRREHRPEILERLARDLANASPDHILVTGDLTHVGLPSECRQAAEWLRGLGSPEAVSLVPGNHDCYASAPWAETAGLWRQYMRGDGAEAGDAGFPYLRRRGPIAVIGLSTAVPTAPFFATGQLGRGQLDRLPRILDASLNEGLFRVVILHHPPVDSVSSFRRRLIDAASFRGVLEQHGAELVLHGHAHRWVRSAVRRAGGSIPVFGIPSASALTPHPVTRAGYSLFDIARDATGWQVRITERRLGDDARAFETSAQETIHAPAAGG